MVAEDSGAEETAAAGYSAPPDAPTLPTQRFVSADEVLDLDAGPAEREPLFRLDRLTDSRRLRRLARVALSAVAVVAVAGAAGVATHSADVHRADGRERDRTLLRLVGGGMTLSVPDYLGSGSQPISTLMQISIRNDGAQAQTVGGLTLDAPGVTVKSAPRLVTIDPGHAAALSVGVSVDCDGKDLVAQPRSVTLQTRVEEPVVADGVTTDASAKTTTLTLPFSPGSGTAGSPLRELSAGSFYELCGYAQVNDQQPVTTYVEPAGHATPGDPSFTFQVTVRNDSERGDVLATETPATTYPGLTVSGALPGSAVPLTSGSPVQAAVTVKVTDCAALGSALSFEDGVRNLVEIVADDLPVASEPADPRFRGPTMSRALTLTGNVSAFEEDLLLDLVAACPGLK